MPSSNMAIPGGAIRTAEPAVHGRPDVDSSRSDILTEQEPGAFALHSTSVGYKFGLAQGFTWISPDMDRSHV